MPKYRYSIGTNFGGKINLRKLHREINDSNGINKTIVGVTKIDADNVDIEFDLNLSTAEQTTLESTLIPIHDNSPESGPGYVFSFPLTEYRVKSDSYKKIGSFIYAGSVYSGINAIRVLSYCQGMDDYDIRVFDVSNNNVIAEGNFTNTTIQINDMGEIDNIPSTDAIFEVQVKGDRGNRWIYIDSMTLFLA